MNSIKRFFKENGLFLLLIVGMVLLRLFVFTPFEVDGPSMNYTLAHGDRLFGANIFNVDRFDIVILDSPTEEGKQYIKRVIGLPGDTISSQDDVIYINDEPLSETYLSEETRQNNTNTIDFAPLTIPEGEYFVMGDNRNHSFDSTEFGPIPEESINAEILFRFWPLNTFGTVDETD